MNTNDANKDDSQTPIPWWLRRLKAFVRFFTRAARSRPLIMVLSLAMLTIVATQGVLVMGDHNSNTVALSRIAAMPKIPVSEFLTKIKSGSVTTIETDVVQAGSFFHPQTKSYLVLIDKNSKEVAFERAGETLFGDDFSKDLYAASNAHQIKLTTGHQNVPNMMSSWLNTILFLALLLIFIVVAQKMATEVLAGHSFKASHPDLETSLDQVIGVDEVKARLREIKDQLLHPQDYEVHGVKPPQGLLFTGDPGVGKTMLARAFANELGADFFTCSGADFVEMFVGVGAKRVRSLFRQARQSRIAVIFIDEIDAVGSRDSAAFAGDSERQATINALLAEMDGMNRNERLLVIGATNHPDRLDSALKRPGRFDRIVAIPLPDKKARAEILRRSLAGVEMGPDVDLDAMSLRTQGYSGASLVDLASEAKRMMARRHAAAHGGLLSLLRGHGRQSWVVTQDLLTQAQENSTLGDARTDVPNSEDLVRVAIHELGHALAALRLCPWLHLDKVTIQGRGQALGYAATRPLEERVLQSQDQMEATLVMFLAGRAAEQVFLGSASGGAANDIQQANHLARSMVVDYGMSADRVNGMGILYPQAPATSGPAPEVPQEITGEIFKILRHASSAARDLVACEEAWFQLQIDGLIHDGVVYADQLQDGLRTDLVPDLPDSRPVWVRSLADQLTLTRHVANIPGPPTSPNSDLPIPGAAADQDAPGASSILAAQSPRRKL